MQTFGIELKCAVFCPNDAFHLHRLLSAIPLLIRELSALSDSDNLAIAFPDEGAWKRFHSDLVSWPTITCIKVREGDNRVVSVKEG